MAVSLEESKGRWIDRVFRSLYYFLFNEDGLESKAAGSVFERTRREMVDVLGIEFLKGGVKKFVVARGVRSLKIKVASRREKAACRREESRDIVNVLEYVAEHDAIKFRQMGRKQSRGY